MGGDNEDSCQSKDVCPACKEAHSHSITLFKLLDGKIVKKDSRLHKALEEHSISIQSSLDEGKKRFDKIEQEAKVEIKDIRNKMDTKCTEERSWVERKFDKRDTDLTTRDNQKKADKRQLIGILSGIAVTSLTALITAIIVFTFLRASVQNMEKQIDTIIEENKECIVINAQLRIKKVIK